MKILLISNWGGSLALGMRMRREGHQVKIWIKPVEGDQSHVGDGFLEKVKSWEDQKDWADFFILDDNGLGGIGETLRQQKKVVWGGNKFTDAIELDRGKGQQAFKDIGMKVIPSTEFSSIDEAVEYIQKKPGRYVLKPHGEVSDNKALSYVGKLDDGTDAVSVLGNWKKRWAAKIKKMEVQEFKKGVEVGVSAFFNGKDFVDPIEITFEHKPLMNGGIGPGTGEMGTSLVWMKRTKIYRETIGKAVKLLAKTGCSGYVDINCIATQTDLWPLEWTPFRFGYPTIQLKMETIKGDIVAQMYSVSTGKPAPFKINNPYSVCVVVATPPWPFTSPDIFKKYAEGTEVIFKTKDRSGIYPGEILRDAEDRWYVTGNGGFSLICVGGGKTCKQAKELAYKRVDNFVLANGFYRTDISDKTDENLKQLKDWGYFKA